MIDEFLALKVIRRKNEIIWRKNPLFINFQKKLFNIVNTLLGHRKQLVLPDNNNNNNKYVL